MAQCCLDKLLYVTPSDEMWAECTPHEQSHDDEGSLKVQHVCETCAPELDVETLHTVLTHPWPWASLECPNVQRMCTFIAEVLHSAALDILACGALDACEARAISHAAAAKLKAAAAKSTSNRTAGRCGQGASHTGAAGSDASRCSRSSSSAASTHRSIVEGHLQQSEVAGNDAAVLGAAQRQPQGQSQTQTQPQRTDRAVELGNVAAGHSSKSALGRPRDLGPAAQPALPAPVVALPKGLTHLFKCESSGHALNAAMLYYQTLWVRYQRYLAVFCALHAILTRLCVAGCIVRAASYLEPHRECALH